MFSFTAIGMVSVQCDFEIVLFFPILHVCLSYVRMYIFNSFFCANCTTKLCKYT